MRRRRATIPVRTRIFLGCEGESEQGYGALLTRLAEGAGLHLAIHSVLLRPGGGDPLDLVTLAVELSRRAQKTSVGPLPRRQFSSIGISSELRQSETRDFFRLR